MPGRRAEHSASSLEVRFNNNPNSRLFSRVADEYRKEGNIARAIEICMKGLEVYPDYVTGRVILGRCYLEQENTDGAVQEFTRACGIDRKNHVAIKMLADIFARQGFEEKAGDLYSILLKMDPSNLSVKQLHSQFKSSENNNLFDILDIAAPQLQEEQNFTSESHDTENQELQPAIDFDENEISAMSPESHDLNFTEELDTIGVNQVQEISGEDISDRMAMMFGDKGNGAPKDTEQTSGNEIELTAPQISESEISELPPLSESSSLTELNEDVSGIDISSRIDELFGEEKNAVPEPDFGNRIELDISAPGISAKNQSSDIDKQSEDESPFADLAIEELTQKIQDVSPSSDSPEQPSFSGFENDYGETVKIDRSILRGFHDDAENKTSNVSGESLIEDLKADFGKIELISESDNIDLDENSPVINISESEPENENEFHDELVSDTDMFTEGYSGKLPDTSEIDLITIDDSPVDENTGAGLSKDNSEHEEFVSEMDVLVEDSESERDSDEIELISEDSPATINAPQSVPVDMSETLEEHVSEMDILADEIPGSVQLTGDDVAKKLDLLFGEPEDDSENSTSVSQLETPFEMVENESLISESNQVLDELEPLEIVNTKNEDIDESLISHIEEPILEINTNELESEQVSLSNADNDADHIETMEMQDEDEVLPEEPMSFDGQAGTSLLDESMEEIKDSGTLFSPTDIEKRLKDLFPENISSPIGMIPEDDEERQDNTAGEFYTVSGENATDGVTFEDLDDFGRVEIDSPVEIKSSEETISEDINSPEPGFSKIDDRDKPYSIPDHVITPTLADLYFQQGQPQLAIQIYERLLKLDPDNDKFKNRIFQIKKVIYEGASSQMVDFQDEKPVSEISKEKKPAVKASSKRKPIDNRPLAGVRIRKNKKK